MIPLSNSTLFHEKKATAAAATAKSLQLCPTLCDPKDGSPPGSPILGILQARTLECVAISFSNAWKWKVKGKSLSRVRLFATPWTGAYQAPPSMGFSRQEYWSGVPLPSPKRRLVLGKKEWAIGCWLLLRWGRPRWTPKTNHWGHHWPWPKQLWVCVCVCTRACVCRGNPGRRGHVVSLLYEPKGFTGCHRVSSSFNSSL